MKTPVPGETYKHKDNGGLYTVEGCLPIKLNNVWVDDGVTIYVSDHTRMVYSRLTSEFFDAFELFEDVTND